MHIQCATIPAPSPTQETEWLESLADSGGYPHAIVAGCRLREPDAGAVLAANAAFPRFRGVRDLTVTDAVAPDDVRGAFDAAADHAASVELMLPLEHYDSVARLAEHWPEVTIVLGHAGQPLERDSRYVAHWSSALSDARQRGTEHRPQAVCDRVQRRSDVDGRQRPPGGAAGDRGVRRRPMHVRQQLADRPPLRHLPTPDRAYRQIAAELPERDQAALLHGTADRVYRI